MLALRGFSAWIESNGQSLPEYLVAVDEKSQRVSCWIPGIEGQTFTVFWKDEGSKVDSCAFMTLDGTLVPGRFLFGEGTASRGGVRVSKTSERPFMFQKVDESAAESSRQGATKDAGMITLKIKRVRRLAGRPANAIQHAPPSVLGKRKAGDICVGFGEEQVQPYQQSEVTWQVASYEDDTPGAKPSTFVSFIFRYRSPDFLESQGIAIVEERKPVLPVKLPTRRMVSLPLPPPPPVSRLESEPPITRPAKKPRIMSQAPNHPVPRGPRRPSAEMRRAVSWTPGKTATEDGRAPSKTEGGRYAGEGEFFLPRQPYLFELPISNVGHPESSGTSASPENVANEEEPKL